MVKFRAFLHGGSIMQGQQAECAWGTWWLLPPLSSFIFILKKRKSCHSLSEKNCVFNFTIKDTHVHMSHWNTIQETQWYSVIRQDIPSVCHFMEFWTGHQQWSDFHGWLVHKLIFFLFLIWLNPSLSVSFGVSGRCPLLKRKNFIFYYMVSLYINVQI